MFVVFTDVPIVGYNQLQRDGQPDMCPNAAEL